MMKQLVKSVDLSLDDIRTDGDTQPRAQLNQEVVDDYAELLKAGVPLPPGKVVHDGSAYWLYSGFHRYFAHRKAGKDAMPVEVVVGTVEDARWLALAENIQHGLRRTNEEKRRAIDRALRQKPDLSDNAIAEHVGVSAPTVATVRNSLAKLASDDGTIKVLQSPARTGRDGRTINTSNIGRPSANGQPPPIRCDDCKRKDCPPNPKCKGCDRAKAAAKAAAKNGAAVPGTEDEDAPHGDDWEPGPGDDPAPVDLEAEAPAEPEPAARQDTPATVVQATKKAEQAIGALSRALDELKVFGKHQRCLQAIKDNVLALSRGEG